MKYKITLTHDCVKFPLPAGIIVEDMCTVLVGNLKHYNIDAVVKADRDGLIVSGYDDNLQSQLNVVQTIHELLDEIDEEL